MTDTDGLHEWRQAAYQASRERDEARGRIAELEAHLEVARSQGVSGTAYLLGDLAGMYSGQVSAIRAWAASTQHGAAAAEILQLLGQPAKETEPREDEPMTEASVSLPQADLDTLLAVATMYIDAFGEDELMSLTERMRLQEVEDVVQRYGRRY